MTQKEFKEKVFADKDKKKKAINKLYDNKKLFNNFMKIFNTYYNDYETYKKLDPDTKQALTEVIFGNNKKVLGSLVSKSASEGVSLGLTRLKDKLKNG